MIQHPLSTYIDGVTPVQLFSIALAVCIALFWTTGFIRAKSRLPRPPGPPVSWIPFVGNYFDIRNHKGTFPALLEKWRKEYGPIFSYKVFNELTVVLCEHEMVHDLFELRSTNYSSRPDFPLLREFISRNNNISFNLYNEGWRRLRRAVHRELNVNQAKQYAWIQEREAYVLAKGVFDHLIKDNPTPDGLFTIAQRFGGSISFGALYDMRVKVDSDPLINEWSNNLAQRLEFFKPGSSFYDYIPWLRWLPEWIMWSKRRARIAREGGEELDYRFSKTVQDRLAAGEETSSFHAGLLQREKEGKSDLTPFERDSLTGMAAVAAIDTSIATTLSLIKALVCWPEVQKKVQEEVDRVVGRDRLPTSADLPNLPYCQAFVRETMRWREITRLGVPHASTADDTYMGYFIPKHSVVIGFAWALARNPKLFPDYDVLRPERYIDPDTGALNNLPYYSFGFGRRICVGMNLAQTSTSMAIATLCWAFDFQKALDEKGQPIPIDIDPETATVENGTIFTPKPFAYVTKARYHDVLTTINACMLQDIHLSDGTYMPCFSFGNGTGGSLADFVHAGAIALGYGIRAIDTAQGYGELGTANTFGRQETMTRQVLEQQPKEVSDSIYVTSKREQVINKFSKPVPLNDIRQFVEGSISRLGRTPNLFLIHTPFGVGSGQATEEDLSGAWKVLEDMKDEGRLRSLGISNFRPQDLQVILKHCRHKPVVNQFEYTPYLLTHLEPLLSLQKENGITSMAWGILTPFLYPKVGPVYPVLVKVAQQLSQRAGRSISPSIVCILWTQQKGVVPVTCSGKQERIQEIAESLSLSLTVEEVNEIEQAGRKIYFRRYPALMEPGFPPPANLQTQNSEMSEEEKAALNAANFVGDIRDGSS